MYRVSVYGKGGAGKSSVAANVSYCLSESGHTVLHLGCDPKHDSTLSLTGGVRLRTYAESGGDAFAMRSGGVTCAECGGPEPGTGCAGKGMEPFFREVSDMDADFRICDVLGDVVCGGFSVPMRRENADAVIVVTSGEFMSLFAANNILRGIRNVNGTRCVMGIVFNSRGGPGERGDVRRFADAVGIPVICEVPRSDLFRRAEAAGRTVCGLFPDSEEASALRELASYVSSDPVLYPAAALDGRSMDSFPSHGTLVREVPSAGVSAAGFDYYDHERNITYSENHLPKACSSHGAVRTCMMVTDAAVVLHGSSDCGYLMEYAFRRRHTGNRAERGGRIPPCNLYCTGLDAGTAFRGDADLLRDTVRRAVSDGFRTVFVVSACSASMIGTDTEGISDSLSRETGARVVPVPGESTFLGSDLGGYDGAVRCLADMFDPSVPRDMSLVNLVSSDFMWLVRRGSLGGVARILSLMGMGINMLFPEFTTTEGLRGFCRAGTDIMVDRTGSARRACSYIASATGRDPALSLDIPYGLRRSLEWIYAICGRTGRDPAPCATALREEYGRMLEPFRPRFAGRKVVMYFFSRTDVLWGAETVRDLGGKVGAIVLSDGDFTDGNEGFPDYGDIEVVRGGSIQGLRDILPDISPDLIVTNDPVHVSRLGVPWCTMGTETTGIDASAELASKMTEALLIPPGRGWEEGL